MATKSQYLLLSPSDKADLKMHKQIWSIAFDSVQANKDAAGQYSLTAPLLEKIQQKIDRIETFLADGYQEGHQRRKVITRRLVGGKDKAVLKATLKALYSLVKVCPDMVNTWAPADGEVVPGMNQYLSKHEQPASSPDDSSDDETDVTAPCRAGAWQLAVDNSDSEEELPVAAKSKPSSDSTSKKKGKKKDEKKEDSSKKKTTSKKKSKTSKDDKKGETTPKTDYLFTPSEGQKPFTDAKDQARGVTVKCKMQSIPPFVELDRWAALAEAGLVADYWIEEVVDDDVEAPVLRTVSYGTPAGL